MSLLQSIFSLQVSFAKETYNFKEPTNRSYPIIDNIVIRYLSIITSLQWITYDATFLKVSRLRCFSHIHVMEDLVIKYVPEEISFVFQVILK